MIHCRLKVELIQHSKLGSLISPDRKAVTVIDDYLSKVIREFSADNGDENERKAQTMLGTLMKQGVSETELKDQLVAVLVGGRVCVRSQMTEYGGIDTVA